MRRTKGPLTAGRSPSNRVLSSVGRAAPLHGAGRRFETVRTHHHRTPSNPKANPGSPFVFPNAASPSPFPPAPERSTMFEPIRKHSKIVMIFLFLLIIPAFVLVGTDRNYFSEASPVVARV